MVSRRTICVQQIRKQFCLYFYPDIMCCTTYIQQFTAVRMRFSFIGSLESVGANNIQNILYLCQKKDKKYPDTMQKQEVIDNNRYCLIKGLKLDKAKGKNYQ